MFYEELLEGLVFVENHAHSWFLNLRQSVVVPAHNLASMRAVIEQTNLAKHCALHQKLYRQKKLVVVVPQIDNTVTARDEVDLVASGELFYENFFRGGENCIELGY